jgi:hypothetical protein
LTFISNPTAKLPLFVCINEGTHTISKIHIMSVVDGEDGTNPMDSCVGNTPSVYLHAIAGPEDIPLYGSEATTTLPEVSILVKIPRNLLGKNAPTI